MGPKWLLGGSLLRLGKPCATVADDVVNYEEIYRLCHVRGPEGVLLGPAQQLWRQTVHCAARRGAETSGDALKKVEAAPVAVRGRLALLNGCSSHGRSRRRKPDRMQQFLKAAPGVAGARVVPSEFLEQLLVSSHHSEPALHAGLGRVALPSLATRFERKGGRRSGSSSPCRTSLVCGAPSRHAGPRFVSERGSLWQACGVSRDGSFERTRLAPACAVHR